MSKSNTNSTLPRVRPSSGHNLLGVGGSSLQSSPAKSSSSANSNSTGLVKQAAVGQPTFIGHSSEFFQLKEQLESSEMRVQALIDSNDDMRGEISRLSGMVNKLVNENHALRVTSCSPAHSTYSNENEYATPQPLLNSTKPLPPVRSAATVSMFEQQRRPPAPPSPAPPASGGGPTSLPTYMLPMSGSQNCRLPPHTPPTSSSFLTGSYQNYYEDGGRGSASLPVSGYESFASPSGALPSQEEVVRRTEAITRCIQELLVSAKDEQFDAFIPCSERIVRAVTDMVSLFPESEEGDDEAPWGRSPLGMSLADLMAAAHHFETECRILIARSQKEPLHQGFVTQQVIQCAFDIAKSTKQLVAMFQ
jgi:G protein-coupled receptor kinase interacting protein 2